MQTTIHLVNSHDSACPKCGASISGGAKTCGSCGAVRAKDFLDLTFAHTNLDLPCLKDKITRTSDTRGLRLNDKGLLRRNFCLGEWSTYTLSKLKCCGLEAADGMVVIIQEVSKQRGNRREK
ncbi:uncharacterized protein J3D65DRAFT_166400 [Phyllosticta citribraziliensis]|uniref:Zinc-ribbon domain-containing protein n=1 Tax=Phyllosticta citribraziliensis TaxID=989973 RepID=A0ABR1L2I2_9PEZI